MRTARDIEHVLDRYGDAVWRACLLYLPPSDAEDVFQDTFLKYALHDKAFHDGNHTKAWLLRVAINACKDVLKAARQRNSSVEELVEAGREGALGVADDEAAHRLAEVTDALNALGDPPKTQLYLALYEGYSAREIAEMTGMPEGTVYSWISRGKKKLREVLT
ncbi:sigma-70 family RNA polymerase sigma factor [Collinsella sp. An268]|uniref:RNA polymerase sigma factor n=1 Tax=Collinsella sp. An268 TaxID=1965612 RepID=UPI000B36946F|nr:sigma-70 family RNA polymerase sigma factor [Collinsella sp. An268]OUO63871.1 RNA polymerase subunit sigma-24 [Collinsella sp. An268]